MERLVRGSSTPLSLDECSVSWFSERHKCYLLTVVCLIRRLTTVTRNTHTTGNLPIGRSVTMGLRIFGEAKS